MSGLANSIADSDVNALTDVNNVSVKRVSNDLQPLPDDRN